MSKRGDTKFLADIKEAVTRIAEYTHKIGYNQFLEDKMTQDAVIRNLQIIGAAVKKTLPLTLRKNMVILNGRSWPD